MTASTLLWIAQVNSDVELLNSDVDLGTGAMIAVTGLFIVFTALILISLFIGSLPRVLDFVARYWPEIEEHHARGSKPDEGLPDDEVVLAAIGFVLHSEYQKQLASSEPPSSR